MRHGFESAISGIRLLIGSKASNVSGVAERPNSGRPLPCCEGTSGARVYMHVVGPHSCQSPGGLVVETGFGESREGAG